MAFIILTGQNLREISQNVRESQLKRGKMQMQDVLLFAPVSRRCIKRNAPSFIQLVINELFLLSAARAIT
jgi:hypothetical protein